MPQDVGTSRSCAVNTGNSRNVSSRCEAVRNPTLIASGFLLERAMNESSKQNPYNLASKGRAPSLMRDHRDLMRDQLAAFSNAALIKRLTTDNTYLRDCIRFELNRRTRSAK